MHIGIVCYEAFHSGGIQVQVRELSNRFVSAGHEVVLFAPPPPAEIATGLNSLVTLRSVPVPVVPLTSMASFALQLPLVLHKMEKERGLFDIVHSHTYADAFLRRSPTRGVRVTTVHHLGTSAAASMGLGMMRRLTHPSTEYGPSVMAEGLCLRRADHLVAVSRFTREEVLRKYPRIDATRISVIYNGSTPRALQSNPETIERLKKGWGLGNDERVLLYVGRLEERKGISFLMHTFTLLTAGLRVRLALVGGGDVSTYASLARKLGIADRVIFAGYAHESVLNAAYGLASALVHPSSMEGFGITIADALASGLPVAATRVGPIPELVREGIDGFLAEHGNPGAFAEAIRRTLEMAAVSQDRGRNSRPTRFTWEKTADETLDLYHKLLSMN